MKFKFNTIKVFLSVFLLLSLPANKNTFAEFNQRNKCPRKILNVCLSKKSSMILDEIETAYGTTVQADLGNKYDVGSSDVSENGPYIIVNPLVFKESKIRQEAAIVHELFHLKLRTAGFGGIKYEPATTPFYEKAGPFLEEMVNLVHSPIEHYIFFPKMKEIGLTPDLEVKSYCLGVLEGKLPDPINEDHQAVFLMRICLEVQDKNLLSRLISYYESKKWNKSLILGKNLAQLVKTANPRTPEDVINVFVACMNSLLNNRLKMEFKEWAYIKKGKFTIKAARILLKPPQ